VYRLSITSAAADIAPVTVVSDSATEPSVETSERKSDGDGVAPMDAPVMSSDKPAALSVDIVSGNATIPAASSTAVPTAADGASMHMDTDGATTSTESVSNLVSAAVVAAPTESEGADATAVISTPPEPATDDTPAPPPIFRIVAEDDFDHAIEASTPLQAFEMLYARVPDFKKRNSKRLRNPGTGELRVFGLASQYFFGFGLNPVQPLLEQLPNAERCSEYKFRYRQRTHTGDSDGEGGDVITSENALAELQQNGRPRAVHRAKQLLSWSDILLKQNKRPVPANPSGCARTQPWSKAVSHEKVTVRLPYGAASLFMLNGGDTAFGGRSNETSVMAQARRVSEVTYVLLCLLSSSHVLAQQ